MDTSWYMKEYCIWKKMLQSLVFPHRYKTSNDVKYNKSYVQLKMPLSTYLDSCIKAQPTLCMEWTQVLPPMPLNSWNRRVGNVDTSFNIWEMDPKSALAEGSCQMKNLILNGSVFGFAKVDIKTLDYLKEKYADFPPIIKHVGIGIDNIGEHMKKYAQENDQMKNPRQSLIGSYIGKEMMMSTPIIRFLINHRLKLEKIYEVIQYDETRPFKAFGDKTSLEENHQIASRLKINEFWFLLCMMIIEKKRCFVSGLRLLK
uniref:Uncharacterized protein n=1 Tax=Romanomermis culicivorax TaxID=13658 RepID=A0A915LAQ9_ROMCU